MTSCSLVYVPPSSVRCCISQRALHLSCSESWLIVGPPSPVWYRCLMPSSEDVTTLPGSHVIRVYKRGTRWPAHFCSFCFEDSAMIPLVSTRTTSRPVMCVAARVETPTFSFCLQFVVLAAVNMKSSVFWDKMQCSTVKVNRSFTGIYCLHLQHQAELTRYIPGDWTLSVSCEMCGQFCCKSVTDKLVSSGNYSELCSGGTQFGFRVSRDSPQYLQSNDRISF
jgi:hypothetical protein